MTIKGENITLTRKELYSIVEQAVTNALEIISERSEKVSISGSHHVNIGEFSSEEYADAMHTMEVNRGKGEEPKVGIF